MHCGNVVNMPYSKEQVNMTQSKYLIWKITYELWDYPTHHFRKLFEIVGKSFQHQREDSVRVFCTEYFCIDFIILDIS